MADRISFTVTLSEEASEALRKLHAMSGKATIEETVVAALKLRGVELAAARTPEEGR